MMFKGIVLKGCLIKLEKLENDQKVAECGIDTEKAQQLWGNQQPLRTEYEKWVSEGGCPVYELVEEYAGFEEPKPTIEEPNLGE
jgi:hypothetical protein